MSGARTPRERRLNQTFPVERVRDTDDEEEQEVDEFEEEEGEIMQDEGGLPEEQEDVERSDLVPIVDSVFGQVSVW